MALFFDGTVVCLRALFRHCVNKKYHRGILVFRKKKKCFYDMNLVHRSFEKNLQMSQHNQNVDGIKRDNVDQT